MDYLKRAVELAGASLNAGEFPAGAVLVTKSGKVYESKPTLPHNHGETMVIDMAIAAEGAPLAGATIYASMQPCLMCSAKMYWAGVKVAHYIIPKAQTHAHYAYENDIDTAELAANFFKPIAMSQHGEYVPEALELYQTWVKKIESK